MSRRRGSTPDPVSRLVMDHLIDQEFSRELKRMLKFLGPTAAAVVRRRLFDDESFAVIAQQVGYSESGTRQIYNEAIHLLRNVRGLEEFVDRDFARIEAFREEGDGTESPELDSDWCTKHGRLAGLRSWTQCQMCPCRFEQPRRSGRRKVYCSKACSSAAQRERDTGIGAGGMHRVRRGRA
ncbi:hypothetical protein GCM10011591_39880 [Nocardia camponoti]|uniref:Uncharacterized protein n=1 Tax=Nocardia camponoti TaxID=1616106 RepID=A0A917QQV6_9NOCA|nr:hypothetical protein GCM10011591_39880 [Nocardia camponoti]